MLQQHIKFRALKVRSKLCISPLNHCHKQLSVCPSWRQNALRKHICKYHTKDKEISRRKKWGILFSGHCDVHTSSTRLIDRIFSVSKMLVYIFYALKPCCSSTSRFYFQLHYKDSFRILARLPCLLNPVPTCPPQPIKQPWPTLRRCCKASFTQSSVAMDTRGMLSTILFGRKKRKAKNLCINPPQNCYKQKSSRKTQWHTCEERIIHK